MVEAIRSVQQTQLRASMSMAVRVLARQRAIKAVKQALAAKGLKPQYIAKREIVAAAEEYLAAHRRANCRGEGNGGGVASRGNVSRSWWCKT